MTSAHRIACAHGLALALFLHAGGELWRISDQRAQLLGSVLEWYEVNEDVPLTGSWS